MTVDTNLTNRPMLESDVTWALRHDLTSSLRRFVDECAKKDVAFWNSIVSNNTFSAAGGRFRTLNWYRLWEYASCHDFLVKRQTWGTHFLDLGGAGCYYSFFLASQGYRVTIIDLDPYMIEISNAIAKKLGLQSRLHCISRDLGRDGARDLNVDAIYSISVIEHIPQEQRCAVLSQMRKALPQGANVFLTFDFGDYTSKALDSIHSLAELSKEVQDSDFGFDGNAFAPEMESLKLKPYASRYYATADDITTFAHNDPLQSQLRFVLKSVALRLGYVQAKDAAKKILGIRHPDYNFCRLLLKTT